MTTSAIIGIQGEENLEFLDLPLSKFCSASCFMAAGVIEVTLESHLTSVQSLAAVPQVS